MRAHLRYEELDVSLMLASWKERSTRLPHVQADTEATFCHPAFISHTSIFVSDIDSTDHPNTHAEARRPTMEEYETTQLDAFGRPYQELLQRPAYENGSHPYDHFTHDDYQQSYDLLHSAPEEEYLHEPHELDSFGQSHLFDGDQYLTTRE